MNIIDQSSVNFLAKNKKTEILVRENNSYTHHCDSIVLEESSSDFAILCASPCLGQLGRTFHVRREGFEHPSEVSLLEGATLSIRGKIFGYTYYGKF